MFRDINQAIAFIESQVTGQVDFIEFKEIYNKYKRKHQPFYIHVTGTNGKGSTAKMFSDVLRNANYKVGLFTSPHMEVSNDRVRINNEYISNQNLLNYINDLYTDIIKYNINFFQIYTLIALLYFQDQACEFAIIEVGIGGLYDSTNVIDAKLAIITNISLDHTEKLGKSIKDIAYNKAGIIKDNSFVLTHVEDEVALAEIRKVVSQTNSQLNILGDIESSLEDGERVFMIDGMTYHLENPAIYQVKNAQIVIAAIKHLNSHGYNIAQEILVASLKAFTWSGRYEVINQDPLVILDGAHNIAGIKALIATAPKDALIIFAAMKDKDYQIMLDLLVANFTEVVFVEFNYYRALKASDLVGIKSFESAKSAYAYYLDKYPNKTVIFCGSLYFVSEVSNNRRDIIDTNN